MSQTGQPIVTENWKIVEAKASGFGSCCSGKGKSSTKNLLPVLGLDCTYVSPFRCQYCPQAKVLQIDIEKL